VYGVIKFRISDRDYIKTYQVVDSTCSSLSLFMPRVRYEIMLSQLMGILESKYL